MRVSYKGGPQNHPTLVNSAVKPVVKCRVTSKFRMLDVDLTKHMDVITIEEAPCHLKPPKLPQWSPAYRDPRSPR